MATGSVTREAFCNERPKTILSRATRDEAMVSSFAVSRALFSGSEFILSCQPSSSSSLRRSSLQGGDVDRALDGTEVRRLSGDREVAGA